MIRMSRSAALGLSLVLMTALVPALPASAQEEDAGAPVFTWTEIDGLSDTPHLLAMAPDGADLLLTAQFGPTGQVSKQRAWRSTDGRTWESVEPPGRESVTAIAGGPAGVVAIDTDGAVYYSPDGLAWERLKLPKKDNGERKAVVATPTGFVMVGATVKTRRARPGTSFTYLPAAWASTDGRDWASTRLSDAPNIARGVAIAQDGTVLAVGSDLETGPLAWRLAADGTWADAAPPPEAPTFIGHAGGRFVISDPEIAMDELWQTTVDGSSWSAGPARVPMMGRPIAAAGGALFAGTLDGQPGLTLRWTPDWETWSESVTQDLGPVQWAWATGTLANGDVLLTTYEPAADGEGAVAPRIWAGTPSATP